MRTLVFSMLAMASMVACTNESDPIQEVNDKPVEIKMTAGVGIVTTKAPLTPDNVTFNAKVIRYDKVEAPASGEWKTVSSSTQANANAGGITFSPIQYYTNTADKKAYFIGYTADKAGDLVNGVIPYAITGDEDIMCTEALDMGTKTSPTKDATLVYKHKLTQLQIKVQAADQGALDVWGTLQSITINTATILDLDLTTGILTPNTVPVLTDLSFLGAMPSIPIKNASDDSAAANAGYIMVSPVVDPVLKITTSTMTDREITITGLTTAISSSHVIILTFKGTQVEAKASIEQWNSGVGGSATVD